MNHSVPPSEIEVSVKRAIPDAVISYDPDPPVERYQSPADRAVFDDTTKCILCGACTSSCPSFWGNHEYVGPAAIVQAHRFIFDSRDEGAQQRLEILNSKEGVWRSVGLSVAWGGCAGRFAAAWTRSPTRIRMAMWIRMISARPAG